jgi:hypothetical protein
VLVAAAFCPQPPLLVPQLAAGAAGELADLRDACDQAVRTLAGLAGRLVVLGASDAARCYPGGTGDFRAYGVRLGVALGAPGRDGPGGPLPLPLLVGAWLAQRAGVAAVGATVGPDGSGFDYQGEPAGLLVMGDGSARRDARAPGGLDPRAAAFDAAAAAALASGDPRRLAGLDLALGAELMAAGTPAWVAAGGALPGAYAAKVSYDAAPYGVGYFVATWTSR